MSDDENYDCIDEERAPRPCPYCHGGAISFDGGSLSFRCPDCEQRDEEDQDLPLGAGLPPGELAAVLHLP